MQGSVGLMGIVFVNKNINRHPAHTTVSWPNPKQWIIVHNSDFMMIIRQSNILSQPSRGNWANWKHTAPYIELWITKRICSIFLTHSTKYIWLTFHKFNVYRQVCTMMIMRWCNVQTNEYDLQAITYPTIGTHHKLHNNDENKIPVFPECICNTWQNMM